jgi:cytochrome P450
VNNLLRNPETYVKLKHEIRTVFKAEKDINLARYMEELPYLTSCIEENLRVFPPAPIGFLRSVNAGGDVIDGHVVPGGVRILFEPSNRFPADGIADFTVREHLVRVS